MSEQRDPPRLRGALLDAGRSELPDAARLAAIAAKLGPIVGGGAGGGGSAAAATTAKTSALAKIAFGVVVGSAIVVGSIVGLQRRGEAPVAIVVTATAAAEAPASIEPLASSVVVARPSLARGATPRTVEAGDPTAEVKLLERAQDALRSRPAEALALCTEHERTFQRGMLAQEREVIAIEALVKLGRMDDARARADRFAAAHPSSSHQRRIDALLAR
jgi:hypothetical protein